jgi:hypothetical protein
VPGSPSKEKAEKKIKRKPPQKMDCRLCGLTLFDKFVLSRHVSTSFFFITDLIPDSSTPVYGEVRKDFDVGFMYK